MAFILTRLETTGLKKYKLNYRNAILNYFNGEYNSSYVCLDSNSCNIMHILSCAYESCNCSSREAYGGCCLNETKDDNVVKK